MGAENLKETGGFPEALWTGVHSRHRKGVGWAGTVRHWGTLLEGLQQAKDALQGAGGHWKVEGHFEGGGLSRGLMAM